MDNWTSEIAVPVIIPRLATSPGSIGREGIVGEINPSSRRSRSAAAILACPYRFPSHIMDCIVLCNYIERAEHPQAIPTANRPDIVVENLHLAGLD